MIEHQRINQISHGMSRDAAVLEYHENREDSLKKSKQKSDLLHPETSSNDEINSSEVLNSRKYELVQETIPFEALCHEALFSFIIKDQNHEIEKISNFIYENSVHMQTRIILSPENQELLRLVKEKLQILISFNMNMKNMLLDLLGDECEMSLLNLTLLKQNPSLYK